MALVGDQQLRANGLEAEKGLLDASPGNKSRPMFQLEPAASESTRAWVAKAFVNSTTDKSVTPKSQKSPSKLTMENAMPKSASVTPSRKSKRSTAFADQDSIEKVAKLKAKKNLEEPNQKGMPAVDSFISFLDVTLSTTVTNLGINLGDSTHNPSFCINKLKKLESDRLSSDPSPNNKLDTVTKLDFSILESVDELNLLTLNQICGEVVEGFSAGEASGLDDLHAVPRRKTRSSKNKKSKSEKHT
jgi:hypothetical protein